jgi:hypothetical protein
MRQVAPTGEQPQVRIYDPYIRRPVPFEDKGDLIRPRKRRGLCAKMPFQPAWTEHTLADYRLGPLEEQILLGQ